MTHYMLKKSKMDLLELDTNSLGKCALFSILPVESKPYINLWRAIWQHLANKT